MQILQNKLEKVAELSYAFTKLFAQSWPLFGLPEEGGVRGSSFIKQESCAIAKMTVRCALYK